MTQFPNNSPQITDQSSPQAAAMEVPVNSIAKFASGQAGSQIQTRTTLEVDRSDMSAVLVTTIQSKIRQKILALQAESRRISTELSAQERTQEKYLEDWCKIETTSGPQSAAFSTFVSAIAAFGPKAATISYGDSTYNNRTGMINSNVTVGTAHGNLMIPLSGPVDPAWVARLDTIEKLTTELNDKNSEIIKTKASLSNTSDLERLARASIAKSIMGNTTEGQQLLTGLNEATLSADILEQLSL